MTAEALDPGKVYLVHLSRPIGDLSNWVAHGCWTPCASRASHGTSSGNGPGGRAEERAAKDVHAAWRWCPDCCAERHRAPRVDLLTVKPRPAERVPLPKPERLPAFDLGQIRGARAVQKLIDVRFSADRIKAVQGRVLAAYVPERASTAAAEEHHGYAQAVKAAIAAHREAEHALQPTTAAAGAAHREGTLTMTTDTTPETRPATEWMKGAQTAYDLIVRQAEAGQSAEHIAGRWEGALATYDDATATDAEREWHAGAKETSADMIQTLRELERLEAEDAQAAGDAAEASAEPEAELEAG